MAVSEEEKGADKPYEASRRKLEEARKRGDIARSQDALAFLQLAVFLGAIYLLFAQVMWPLTQDISRYLATGFERGFTQKFDGDLGQSLMWCLRLASVVFLVPLAVMLIALIATQQMVFAGEKLRPRSDRISPVANFKKKFGLSGLVEFLKGLAKVIALSALLFIWVKESHSRFDLSATLEDRPMLANFLSVTLAWLWQVLGVSLVFAVLDVLWQRHQHAKSNRMSHKEMKDEHKNEEGDEFIRQQRRARGEEIATNRMLHEVPKSTVIIVNPTHYAVALAWSGGQREVPRCVAKGVDQTAFRIREIAMQSGIPIYSDPPTARDLYATVKLGAEIEETHYRAVAVAMGYAKRIEQMARNK